MPDSYSWRNMRLLFAVRSITANDSCLVLSIYSLTAKVGQCGLPVPGR